MKKTVLVIDDDFDICTTLRDCLESETLQVLITCDGASALEMVRKEKPDVIISDYRMPGLNGLEVLEELAKLGVDTPVIWFTGTDDHQILRQAWDSKVFDFFQKPAEFEKLRQSIERALKRKTESAA